MFRPVESRVNRFDRAASQRGRCQQLAEDDRTHRSDKNQRAEHGHRERFHGCFLSFDISTRHRVLARLNLSGKTYLMTLSPPLD